MAPDGFCSDCGFFQAHGATCPTRLRTRAKRIERAAHLFAVFSNPEVATLRCECDGISDTEQRGGREIAERRHRSRAELISYRGDPSYGGWTTIIPDPELILPDELPLVRQLRYPLHHLRIRCPQRDPFQVPQPQRHLLLVRPHRVIDGGRRGDATWRWTGRE